jgi:mono/diheme cytochrome c family protein
MSQRTTCGFEYLLATVLSTAWATAQDKRPPPADHPVDFHKEIVSILANSCAKCHSSGKRKGDFSFDTRESLLAGGKTGPAVVVGKSGESLLVDLVAGVDPKKIMPKQGPRLTATQVGLLRAWIDQGLNWEEGRIGVDQPDRSVACALLRGAQRDRWQVGR